MAVPLHTHSHNKVRLKQSPNNSQTSWVGKSMTYACWKIRAQRCISFNKGNAYVLLPRLTSTSTKQFAMWDEGSEIFSREGDRAYSREHTTVGHATRGRLNVRHNSRRLHVGERHITCSKKEGFTFWRNPMTVLLRCHRSSAFDTPVAVSSAFRSIPMLRWYCYKRNRALLHLLSL